MGVKVRELPRKCFSWRDKNSSCSMTLCNAYLIIVNEILSYSSVYKEEKQLIWLKSPCKGVNKGKLILREQYEHLDYKKIKPWGSSRTKWIQGKGKLSKWKTKLGLRNFGTLQNHVSNRFVRSISYWTPPCFLHFEKQQRNMVIVALKSPAIDKQYFINLCTR